jgi:hypothetical protein
MAGAIGHVFGNSPRWHFGASDDYPFVGTWEESLNHPAGDLDLGTVHLGLFGSFVSAVAELGTGWEMTTPDAGDTFLTSGEGSGTTQTAARFSTSLGIAYKPQGGSESLTFDLTELSAFPLARLRKYDPTNGTFTTIGDFATTGSLVVSSLGTNAKGDNDWVLIFDKSPNS